MRLRKLKPFLIAVVFSLTPFAADAKKGEDIDGSSSKEAIAYNKKEARMNTLRSRIDEANRSFNELVERKNKSHDRAEQQSIAEDLVRIEKERKEWMRELTEISQELSYKHPSKGRPIDKKFTQDPARKVAPKQDAQDAGLDERLTETKRLVDKKYAPLIPKEEQEAELTVPAAAKPSKKLRLEK